MILKRCWGVAGATSAPQDVDDLKELPEIKLEEENLADGEC